MIWGEKNCASIFLMTDDDNEPNEMIVVSVGPVGNTFIR